MARADEIRKQVVSVWEGVKRSVEGRGKKAGTQIERELMKLRGERDRLLARLGEQTLTWINKSPVPVPDVVKGTVAKLNDLVESLKHAEAGPAVEVKHYKAQPYAKPKTAAATKKTSAPKKKAAPPKAAAPKAPKKAQNKAPVGKKAIQ